MLQSQESEAIEQVLNGWITQLSLEKTDDEAIAVDGKVLSVSHDSQGHQSHERCAVLHEQATTIAQMKNEKSRY